MHLFILIKNLVKNLRKYAIKLKMKEMKKILLEIKTIIDKSNTDNYDSNFINGEKIMFILLTKTNFKNLKNPIKCLRKIVAKLSQKKNLEQVYKYCKLVGLEQIESQSQQNMQ